MKTINQIINEGKNEVTSCNDLRHMMFATLKRSYGKYNRRFGQNNISDVIRDVANQWELEDF